MIVELLRFEKQIPRQKLLSISPVDRLDWLERQPYPTPRDPLFDQAWHCLNDLIRLGLGQVKDPTPGSLDLARIEVISKWKSLPNFKDLRPYLWGDMPDSLKREINRILRS